MLGLINFRHVTRSAHGLNPDLTLFLFFNFYKKTFFICNSSEVIKLLKQVMRMEI